MGIFNIFGKSALQKVVDELNENNLDTMARLLIEAKSIGYPSISEQSKRMECEGLKKNFNLKKGPANESLNRFMWAKDICEKHNFSNGAKVMQTYVDVYNIYLKDFCE